MNWQFPTNGMGMGGSPANGNNDPMMARLFGPSGPRLGPQGMAMNLGPAPAPSLGTAAMPGAAAPQVMPNMGTMPPPPPAPPAGKSREAAGTSYTPINPAAPLPMRWQPSFAPSQGGGMDMQSLIKMALGGGG